MKPVVLVTGAGTGIGRATCEIFLRNDWDVVAVGRRREPLEAVKALAPERVTSIPCDVTSTAHVEGLRLKIENGSLASRLKCLVNNAGQFAPAKFSETPDSVWQAQFDVNFFGSIRVTRAVVGHLMINQGSIVNISSGLGLRPKPGTLAYSATKAAMNNWTQGLAQELAPQVRVNCVCPGFVDTPIHSFHSLPREEHASALKQMRSLQPLGRIGTSEEIAESIYFLGSEKSAWTTGAILSVDGGINLV